jgi:hypothetical protein
MLVCSCCSLAGCTDFGKSLGKKKVLCFWTITGFRAYS